MPELTRPVAGGDVEASWGTDVTDRVVSRYANPTARDAAAPHQDGMVCYVISNNEFQTFDGSAWTASLDVTTAAATYLTQAQADAAYLALAGGTMAGALLLADGTEALPSLGFASVPGNGFFNVSFDDWELATNGEAMWRFDSLGNIRSKKVGQTIRNDDGDAGTPSYRFESDPDTGMYRKNTNQLGFAAAGVEAAYFTSSLAHFNGEIGGEDGSIASPTFHFNSDTNTGMFKHSATGIAFSVDSTQNFRIAANAIYNYIHPTTTSAASCFLESSGLFYRVTSMASGKANVTNLSAKSAKDLIAGLEPKRFTSKLQGDKDMADNPDNPLINKFVGFIADDVHESFPEAAVDESYDDRAILAALVKVVQGLL